jgi:hypothetical protein
VSLHVCVGLGPVLASHAPSPPAAALQQQIQDIIIITVRPKQLLCTYLRQIFLKVSSWGAETPCVCPVVVKTNIYNSKNQLWKFSAS